MNYTVSLIASLESCNAGVPLSLLRDAAADIVRDQWQDDNALAGAIADKTLDIPAWVEEINDQLSAAGCIDSAVDEDDVRAGLDQWYGRWAMYSA